MGDFAGPSSMTWTCTDNLGAADMPSMALTSTLEQFWSYAPTDMWGPWRLWTASASSTYTSHCSCYRCSGAHRPIDHEPVFLWIKRITSVACLRPAHKPECSERKEGACLADFHLWPQRYISRGYGAMSEGPSGV